MVEGAHRDHANPFASKRFQSDDLLRGLGGGINGQRPLLRILSQGQLRLVVPAVLLPAAHYQHRGVQHADTPSHAHLAQQSRRSDHVHFACRPGVTKGAGHGAHASQVEYRVGRRHVERAAHIVKPSDVASDPIDVAQVLGGKQSCRSGIIWREAGHLVASIQ